MVGDLQWRRVQIIIIKTIIINSNHTINWRHSIWISIHSSAATAHHYYIVITLPLSGKAPEYILVVGGADYES